MVVNDELESVRKEAAVVCSRICSSTCFEVLS
jgi:hypothetical protein